MLIEQQYGKNRCWWPLVDTPVIACVQGSTNGTNGISISFKVLPMVPLVKPLVPMECQWYHWLSQWLVPLVSRWYHWGNPEQSQCQVLAGRDHNEAVDDTINNYCFVLLVSDLQLLPSYILHHCRNTTGSSVIIEAKSGDPPLDSFHLGRIGFSGCIPECRCIF